MQVNFGVVCSFYDTNLNPRSARRQTPDRHSTTVNTDRHPDNNNSTVKEVPTVEGIYRTVREFENQISD